VINGRETVLKNGGLRNGTLFKEASGCVLTFETGQENHRSMINMVFTQQTSTLIKDFP